MKLELDSISEEIIAVSLDEIGIAPELIDKCIEAIKYSMKETNYLHNSVADSNFYAAEVRKENQTIINLRNEVDTLHRKHQKELEETIREKNRTIYRLQDRIEELERQVR